MDELMQIPDTGELEWLESCCLLSDYEEEEEFLVNEEDTETEDRCFQAPVFESPHPRDTKASGKRIWSEKESTQDCQEVSCEEGLTKRRALDKEEDEKHDENWLRYSQSLPKVVDVHEVFENDHPMTEAPMVEKILSRFAIDIEGECIPITGPSGDRVYAKLQRKEMADRGLNNLGMDKAKDGLISEPISAIIAKLDHEAFAKAFEEEGELPSHPTITEQLWVEKYAPSSFSELLSDDQTNREVLLWLKQWDSCVFGSQIKATTDDVLSALRSHSSNFQHQKFSERNSLFNKARSGHFGSKKLKPLNLLDRKGKNFNGASESWSKKTMFDHPPGQKVLLLCGPPGLGKTTLAHVAAKHCGYRVVEINASDDRSSAAIESKILDAVQMNSVVADSKPKCLVIDEIDGSLGEGKGAVEVILKMVAADKKNSTERANPTEQASSGNSSKKGPKSARLLRPVICICNDLYAPALRPIRQIAKVHIFLRPSVSRVVNRLKHICKREGYKTNSIALATLAEYTECDIRSCLNTLQFLNKKKETLNILEVGSQVVGRKDISRSYFDIWKVIFHKRKNKREKRPKNDASGCGDFYFMYSVLSNRGDHDLALDGIHENFLGVSYHDPLMLKTVKCLDMVGVADRLHQYIMRNQQMALYAYQPLLAITISRLIARVEKPNIEWPKSLQRCRNLFMEKMELLKLWQSRISPNMSRHLSTEYFSEDFVSHFLHILAPLTLRPVSLHLFSEREKDELAQLVDTMVTYSLTYKNSRDENLQVPDKPGSNFVVPVLSLEPPIDDFINFKDYKPEHLGLSLAMKQVLLHEVEKQKILRESSGRSSSLRNQNVNHSQTSNVSNSELLLEVDTSNSVYDQRSGKPTVTNLKKQMGGDNISSSKLKGISNTIKAPANSMKPRPSTDFFNRFRIGSNIDLKNVADNLQKKATAERDSRPFLFKYNEGFTNAVKRPVKVRELL